MDYLKVIKFIPLKTREPLSNKLVDFILKSKRENNMIPEVANTILNQFQKGHLEDDVGLAAVLEAAVLLESEKTIDLLEKELQLLEVAKSIKELKEPNRSGLND